MSLSPARASESQVVPLVCESGWRTRAILGLATVALLAQNEYFSPS